MAIISYTMGILSMILFNISWRLSPLAIIYKKLDERVEKIVETEAWSLDDGKKCIELINNFRVNTYNNYPSMTKHPDVVWLDELFEFSKEHSDYMAKAGKVSHDDFDDRQALIKSCDNVNSDGISGAAENIVMR